nr:MAG TPA: hypothetical protein [Caudoviricetes sp.]
MQHRITHISSGLSTEPETPVRRSARRSHI